MADLNATASQIRKWVNKFQWLGDLADQLEEIQALENAVKIRKDNRDKAIKEFDSVQSEIKDARSQLKSVQQSVVVQAAKLKEQRDKAQDDMDAIVEVHKSKIEEAKKNAQAVTDQANKHATVIKAAAEAEVKARKEELKEVDHQLTAAADELRLVNEQIADAKAKAKALFQGLTE